VFMVVMILAGLWTLQRLEYRARVQGSLGQH